MFTSFSNNLLRKKLHHFLCRKQSSTFLMRTLSLSSYQDDGEDTSYRNNNGVHLDMKSFFNPTDEHYQLREMVKTFVEREVSFKL